ncbi:ParB/RepB/Spo0J family partition protein [Magnetospirillum sp. UT-4]|uniref:ParB/RepB/Spo0J family partition protein n=1 Tax=Magnetospirillum sp. UT-4 TaxID=2681467 RepID=UPI00137C3F63|nr:ParB/RepB/Spo0J family partition protein [Magnetospirillum sp. UT-4]CAA7621987.1 Chromosome-partitioning protein ParB [Magnetospirillum sp. UT-4]
MAEEKRRNLGRGLSALLGDSGVAAAAVVMDTESRAAAAGPKPAGLRTLPIGQLKPGKFQPRRQFSEEAIADLAESVRTKGVLQPILVRPHDGGYEIIAGERRWRAAQRAQLHEVPVIVRELTDKEALEVALVENLQRQDLTALEEAEGYRRLVEEFSHTQEELARAVGKSRSHVANMMRLLALPDPVKGMLDQGTLSAGHARALLTAADPVGLARQVAEKQLNVRQTEKLAAAGGKPKAGGRPAKAAARDADTAQLERDMAEMLGLKVDIRPQGRGGELVLHYSSLEQLDDLLSRLTGERK